MKRVLFVEDEVSARERMSKFLMSFDKTLALSGPEDLVECREEMLFTYFHGALVDLNLAEWHKDTSEGIQLNGHKVFDGVDLIKFYRDIESRFSIGVVTANQDQYQGTLGEINQDHYILIEKPVPPDPDKIEALFTPFMDLIDHKWKEDPFINPRLRSIERFERLSAFEKLSSYKSVLRYYSPWIDYHFNAVGNFSSVVICDGEISKRYHATEFGTRKPRIDNLGIQTVEHCPTWNSIIVDLDNNVVPFVCWNMRFPRDIVRHIDIAGPELKGIPDEWGEYFIMALVFSFLKICANGAKEAEMGTMIAAFKEFTFEFQYRVVKEIYKEIYTQNAIDKEPVDRLSDTYQLPKIIDLFSGEVTHIEKKIDEATVLLTHIHDKNVKSIESFSFDRLQKSGVRWKGQKFEYIVFEDATRNAISSRIDSVELSSDDPFAFMDDELSF